MKQGVEVWNEWRKENRDIVPDLTGADFMLATLTNANLMGANLMGANLMGANLQGAKLQEATLTNAKLQGAILMGAYLQGANIERANLYRAALIETNVEQATLTGCFIYGLSVWNIQGTPRDQSNLVITHWDEPVITVDNLQVAQFIYLLLNNAEIRNVIDTMTSKVVLILGRFTEERKAVLDALRDALRQHNYLPILFDFDKPASKDVTGTVETLARMARFIIADLTDPSSIPHELATIVPFLRTTPILPLRLAGSSGYSMFDDFQDAYRWVLQTYEYEDPQSLIASLPHVIAPANDMADKLRKTRQS